MPRIAGRWAGSIGPLGPMGPSRPPLAWTPPGRVDDAAPHPGRLHVVLGAGQVGSLVAAELRTRGHQVRVVHRRAGPPPAAGIEVAHADVSGADDVAHLTDGAACVYHCARPGSLDWPPALLSMARGVAEGTRRSGVDLVVLDDLSAYGGARVLGPGTPCRPRSYGGRLRAQAAEILLDPAVHGGRRVVVARAPDLFGPGVTTSVVFGERFFRRVLSGRPAGVYGDPDLPHSYAYVLDVVAGLVALGASGVASGVYMLPVEPAEPTRSVIQRFYEAIGVDPGVARLSTWALRLKEFFSPGVEDLGDRVYQWKQPFVVDDRRIRSELGLAPSPWDEAVRHTVAWGCSAFGSRRGWPPSGKSAHRAGPWRMVRPREDPT